MYLSSVQQTCPVRCILSILSETNRRKICIADFLRSPEVAMQQQTVFPPFKLPTFPTIAPLSAKDFSFQSTITAILVCIFVLLLLKCMWPIIRGCCTLFKRTTENVSKRVEFTILFSAGNTKQHLSIPLLVIPYSIKDYDFRASQYMTSFDVRGKICPKLYIDWLHFSVKHKFSQLKYILPKSVSLNYLQAYQLRKMMRGQHYTTFHLQSDNSDNLQALPISHVGWASAPPNHQPSTSFARTIATLSEKPPMYSR